MCYIVDKGDQRQDGCCRYDDPDLAKRTGHESEKYPTGQYHADNRYTPARWNGPLMAGSFVRPVKNVICDQELQRQTNQHPGKKGGQQPGDQGDENRFHCLSYEKAPGLRMSTTSLTLCNCSTEVTVFIPSGY